jgi:hypothetical protein
MSMLSNNLLLLLLLLLRFYKYIEPAPPPVKLKSNPAGRHTSSFLHQPNRSVRLISCEYIASNASDADGAFAFVVSSTAMPAVGRRLSLIVILLVSVVGGLAGATPPNGGHGAVTLHEDRHQVRSSREIRYSS